MRVNEVHSLMMEEAKMRNLPTAFRADLTKHDLDQLNLSFPDGECGQFLWSLLECGTIMLTETNYRGASGHTRSSMLQMFLPIRGNEHINPKVVYLFDGENLRVIPTDEIEKTWKALFTPKPPADAQYCPEPPSWAWSSFDRGPEEDDIEQARRLR